MTTYAEVMNSDRIYNDALAFLQLQTDDLKDYTYESVVSSKLERFGVNSKGARIQNW